MFGSLDRRFLAVAVLALVLAAGTIGWRVYSGYDASVPQTIVVHPQTFNRSIAVSGSVVAKHDVDLGFAQSGRVSGVYAAVGDEVQAGTLLAEIENGNLHAAVEQAQAALQEQEANLQSLEAGTRPEQIAVTQASVRGDQVALSQADQSLADAIQSAYTAVDSAIHNTIDLFLINPRSTTPSLSFTSSDSAAQTIFLNDRVSIEQALSSWEYALSQSATSSAAQSDAPAGLAQTADLLQQGNDLLNGGVPSASVPQTTLNIWIADAAAARTAINAAQSSLTAAVAARAAAQSALDRDQKNLLLEQAGSTADAIAAQQAVVSSAQATVQNAQATFAQTQVVAPFDGVVTRMDAKVGQVVSPNDPQISLMSNGLFQIDCYVPEVEFDGLAVGERATTTLDAYGPSVSFPATVVSIDPAETIVDGVPTYKTTLQFLATDPRIRSGMTANVSIAVQSSPNALVVPQGAVFSRGGQSYAQVIRGGILSDVPVVEGGGGAVGDVQITSGLSDGDTVVLNPDTSR